MTTLYITNILYFIQRLLSFCNNKISERSNASKQKNSLLEQKGKILTLFRNINQYSLKYMFVRLLKALSITCKNCQIICVIDEWICRKINILKLLSKLENIPEVKFSPIDSNLSFLCEDK